jgi:uncharacterized protein (TIGR03435 family)
MRTILVIGLLWAGGAAFAEQETSPTFEVASVKPAPPLEPGKGMRVGCSGGPGSSDPGMLHCVNYSMSNLLVYAYSIKSYQLTGPGWMDSERYEIVAKVPAGVTKEQVRLMMRSLLAERFHLVIHHEQKEMPIYDLTVAKGGSKLKEWVEPPPLAAAADNKPAAAPDSFPKFAMGKDGFPDLPRGSGAAMIMMNGKARRQGQETMADFASWLSAQAGRHVSDATGLKAKYDISIYWAEDSGRAAPPNADGTASAPEDSGPTLFGALQEQLGLKLESKKGMVDTIVVDRVERVPTEN